MSTTLFPTTPFPTASFPTASFPTAIQTLLVGYSSTGENLRTSSQAEVYFYESVEGGLFVKRLRVDPTSREADLRAEKRALEWLQGKLAVPRLVGYERSDGVEYLVTEGLPGWPSYDPRAKEYIPGLIGLLAQGLREIHALPIEDCPLDCRADIQIERLEGWFDEGIITLAELHGAVRKATVQQSLEAIRQLQPEAEDLVFTHGDYCLPNVLVQDKQPTGNQLTGFIDLGYAGVGDRYCDFIAADYSIRRNLGDEWVPLFWEAYGVEIDPKKFEFYQLLHDIV